MKLPKLFHKKEPVIVQDVPPLKERVELYLTRFDDKDPTVSDDWMAFLKTLRTTELIDLADFSFFGSNVSIWDYVSDVVNPYEKEFKCRYIPKDEDIIDLLNEWHPNWSSKDSKRQKFDALMKQVDGIQKKVDNIMKVLSKLDVCLSAQEAVELAK